MAAYEWGVTATEVLTAVGHPDPSTVNLPSSTALTGWITRFSARINESLAAHGLTAGATLSTADDDLYQVCRHQVIARVGAEWLLFNQRGAFPERAQIAIDEWKEFLRDLRERPNHLIGSTGSSVKPETGPARNTLTGELTSATTRTNDPVKGSSWYT